MRKMPTGMVMQPRDMVAKLRGRATPTDWNNFMLTKHKGMTHDEANVALRGGQPQPQSPEGMIQVQGPDGRMYEVPEGYTVVEGPGGTIRVVPEVPMDSDDGGEQPGYWPGNPEEPWEEGDPVEPWMTEPPGYWPGGVEADEDGVEGYDPSRDRRRMMR